MRCEGYIVWRVQNCIRVNFYTMVSTMNRYIIKNDEMEEVDAGKKGPSTTDVPFSRKIRHSIAASLQLFTARLTAFVEASKTASDAFLWSLPLPCCPCWSQEENHQLIAIHERKDSRSTSFIEKCMRLGFCQFIT